MYLESVQQTEAMDFSVYRYKNPDIRDSILAKTISEFEDSSVLVVYTQPIKHIRIPSLARSEALYNLNLYKQAVRKMSETKVMFGLDWSMTNFTRFILLNDPAQSKNTSMIVAALKRQFSARNINCKIRIISNCMDKNFCL